MPESYISADVQCPFYTADDGSRRLNCEGIAPRSHTRTLFERTSDWRRHVNRYCCADYGSCGLYRALWAKYD